MRKIASAIIALFISTQADELFTLNPSTNVETSKQSYDSSDSLQTSSSPITIYAFSLGLHVWKDVYASYTYGQSMKLPLPWLAIPNDIRTGHIAKINSFSLLFSESHVEATLTVRQYPNGKTFSNGTWTTFDAHDYRAVVDVGSIKDHLVPNFIDAHSILMYRDYTMPRNWVAKSLVSGVADVSSKSPLKAHSRLFMGGIDIRVRKPDIALIYFAPHAGLLIGAGPSSIETEEKAINDSTDIYGSGTDTALEGIYGLEIGSSICIKDTRLSVSFAVNGTYAILLPVAYGVTHGFDYDGTKDSALREKNTKYRVDYTGSIGSFETSLKASLRW